MEYVDSQKWSPSSVDTIVLGVFQAAMRGLLMGGLKIASVSDITPIYDDGMGPRTRKVRRV